MTHDGGISVEAHLPWQVTGAGFSAPGRNQNPNVRFWIITMMLVLVGLSTLKLR